MSLLEPKDKGNGKDKEEPKRIIVEWGVDDNGHPFVKAGGVYPASIVILEGVMNVAKEQLINMWMIAQQKKTSNILKATDSVAQQIKNKLKLK